MQTYGCLACTCGDGGSAPLPSMRDQKYWATLSWVQNGLLGSSVGFHTLAYGMLSSLAVFVW